MFTEQWYEDHWWIPCVISSLALIVSSVGLISVLRLI